MGMVLTWKTPASSLSLAVFEIMCVIQGFICKLQINRDSIMKPSSGRWAGSTLKFAIFSLNENVQNIENNEKSPKYYT